MLAMVTIWLSSRNAIKHEYPLSGIVQEIENDTVIVMDGAGNEWSFNGAEDWEIGDIAAILMKDMNTQEIYDDQIVSVRYCGNINALR